MNKYIFIVVFAVLSGNVLKAQSTNSKGHFIVEKTEFTPPENDLMNEFIGKKAMNFMANNQHDQSVSLSNFKGQDVLLGFWSVDEPIADEMVKYMDIIAQEGKVKVVGYIYEDKAAMMEYVRQRPTQFRILPHGKFISEMSYAHDLGQPRMFFIDKTGTIKEILPASFFKTHAEGLPYILSILEMAF